MNQEKIGKFIADSRKRKGLTQEKLAEKLGVSDRTIGNWENGRNMPDLSLFKPLCEELDITINELISGEKIKEEEYQEKFEENIISTIDYTNKKINQKNNLIGILLMIFGVLISVTALSIFASESSWGSVYSVVGGIISLIGLGRIIKKMDYSKKVVCIFGYFLLYIIILYTIDFIGVINIHQAPRFTYTTTTYGDEIYYDTPLYDVIRCDTNKKVETWNIEKNKKYTRDEVIDYCRDVKIKRFENLIAEYYDKTSTIVISKLVDNTSSDKQYVTSLDPLAHELVEIIEDKQDIKNIMNILNNVKYPEFSNAIGYSYLFQLYDKENNLILEFKENYIETEDENIMIYFEDKELQKLKQYYK